MSDSSPESLLSFVLDEARKAGATDADARISKSNGVSVSVREGALESVERDEAIAVSLRCFSGQRQAHVSGSDLSKDALLSLVERCAAMAKVVPEDQYCGLANAAELATDNLDLDLRGDDEISTDRLEQEALAAEAAALSVNGVKQVAGSGASWSIGERWVASTNGFRSYRTGSRSSLGLTAIAEKDGAMERDYDNWSVRKVTDRPSAEEIGKTAGSRAVARIGSKKADTQKVAVIYDKRISTSLLSIFLGAISGPSVARGVSFLRERMGDEVFAKGIDILDDPFRPMGMGSRAHDGEGRPVAQTKLIDDGKLTTWLLNGPSAKQLGLTPNGFASNGFGDPPGVTTSNVHLNPGNLDQAGLMKHAGKGLLVTDMFGPSINQNNGDYSVGVAGQWFENGEISHPVSEVTIAGSLPEIFKRLIPGSDLEFKGARNAPSILVEDMSLAGS